MCTNILLENLKSRDHSEDIKVDGRIMLKQILDKSARCVYWIYVAHGTDWCRTLANTAIKLPHYIF